MNILRKVYGPDHLHTAIITNNLGLLYLRMGSPLEAEPLFEQALSEYREKLGPTHQFISGALANLSTVNVKLNRIQDAISLRDEALSIEDENLNRALMMSEIQHRLSYARIATRSTHETVSLHMQAARDDIKAAEISLNTILRRKGRAQDLTTQSYRMLRRLIPRHQQAILDDFSEARANYAALLHRGLRTGSLDRHQARLAALEELQADLWGELVRLVPQITAQPTSISIEEVQRGLDGNAALVEYVSYRSTFGPENSNGSKERYYAPT